MVTVAHGVCRAVDRECGMNGHGRAWRMPGRRHGMWNEWSRSCVAYAGLLTWNVEWIATIVRSLCRGNGMECGMDGHGRALRMPGH